MSKFYEIQCTPDRSIYMNLDDLVSFAVDGENGMVAVDLKHGIKHTVMIQSFISAMQAVGHETLHIQREEQKDGQESA